MQHAVLGGTGTTVSRLALGAMMFGPMGNPDHDDSVRIIHHALDSGVTLVDTADVYSSGESEVIVGKAVAGRRDDVVLATKFGLPREDLPPNERGASPRWIKRAVENSLRRLGTDRIDLYQLHRHDPDTPLEETLGALDDLVAAGKILAFGSSTFPAETIVEAQWAAARAGTRRFLTEQPRYSILNRGIERSVLPTTLRHGMGTLVYGPLASGWLTERSDPSSSHRASISNRMFDQSVPGNRDKATAVAALRDVASDAGLSMTQLAVGFTLAHPGVTAALIGPRTMEQLEDLLTSADVVLPAAVLDGIDAIVPPGAELSAADTFFVDDRWLTDASLRRR